MIKNTAVAFFEDKQVRRERHNDERWFSIVDIISLLTGSERARKYRNDLKTKLTKEEWYTELSEKIGQLKFMSSDSKKYKSDATNTQTMFRIIQSIPSPKAENVKQWLASLGNQRVEEGNDPELGMQRSRERAIQVYKSRWMSDKEIKQRLQSIDIRHDYTDELKTRGIQGKEYSILTNISYSRSWKDAEEYKKHKWLTKNDNLRDHMTRTEMLLTGLSEEAGTEIAKSKNAQGFNAVQDALLQWSDVAKHTKENLEEKIWKSILDPNNRLTTKQQALRKQARKQEKLGYNKNKTKKKK
ncbi:MAG: hypothetical protein ACD_80C00145G0030 [uncultured bacterium (gcode 4)]|uniref:Bro-N domain-containing protein n=1 Tax=uncultured bacterium (gcode 4) TaxID=1234023 RepID=K1XI24_9BACT|nr:MAG: hypothetical protein ACD_80C00145G0030 [uncultured bacterium (gcode 4)]